MCGHNTLRDTGVITFQITNVGEGRRRQLQIRVRGLVKEVGPRGQRRIDDVVISKRSVNYINYVVQEMLEETIESVDYRKLERITDKHIPGLPAKAVELCPAVQEPLRLFLRAFVDIVNEM